MTKKACECDHIFRQKLSPNSFRDHASKRSKELKRKDFSHSQLVALAPVQSGDRDPPPLRRPGYSRKWGIRSGERSCVSKESEREVSYSRVGGRKHRRRSHERSPSKCCDLLPTTTGKKRLGWRERERELGNEYLARYSFSFLSLSCLITASERGCRRPRGL